jgi:hypothetical protein
MCHARKLLSGIHALKPKDLSWTLIDAEKEDKTSTYFLEAFTQKASNTVLVSH